MKMTGLTVEYQRFGDPTGILRLSDRYIRTVGTTEPTEEVSFELPQETLSRAMAALDYGRFDFSGAAERAERMLAGLAPFVERFLLRASPIVGEGALLQIDVVTRMLELAQLPFEIIEEVRPEIVVTRRIRQPWPPPPVVEGDQPKILFAWAEPKNMDVPHDRHREILLDIVKDFGGENAITEVENATRAKLCAVLDGTQRFTHLHLLVHGVPPVDQEDDDVFDLTRKPPPPALLALETEDGKLDRCPPAELAEWLSRGPRPQAATIATCHGAEVRPIASGGTVAHVLHASGVPIVLASQLALTKEGSDRLVSVFLRELVEGTDPRCALWRCRQALRDRKDATYYDRIALVGYVHVDPELDERLKERSFRVALARLKAITDDARNRVKATVAALASTKELTFEQRADAEEIRVRFRRVRDRLAEREADASLTKAQREELLGLHASSLKREAEAAWALAQRLGSDLGREWLELSRQALRDATDAYERAARVSRDHHWTWVQWLALLAVQHGPLLAARLTDWTIAAAAAGDLAVVAAPPDAGPQRDAVLLATAWACGSCAELHLLAPLVGRGNERREAETRLDRLVEACRALGRRDPIDATLAQFERYESWWGVDEPWKLPPQIVTDAGALRLYLAANSRDVP